MATAVEISARRDYLVAAFSDAARIAKNGKPIPVMGSLLAEIVGDRLTWWVTDTHVWRSGAVPVTAKGDGRGLVRVDVALAFLKRCPDGDVRLSIGHDQVVLKAGGFVAKIQSFPLEDFPRLPTLPTGGLSLARKALASAVGAVSSIVSNVPPNKYFLNGALFRVDQTAVTCVATDGHRLVKIAVPHESVGDEVDTLLHRQGLSELVAMLQDGPDTATYSLLENFHVFQVGDNYLLARPLEAQFPQWERIIPKKITHEFTCDREAWLAAAERVAQAAAGEHNSIRLECAEGDVRLTAQSAEKGDAADRVPVVDVFGPPTPIAFQARYLIECLKGFDCDAVTCRVQDELSQALFIPAKSDGKDHLHVIMPTRL